MTGVKGKSGRKPKPKIDDTPAPLRGRPERPLHLEGAAAECWDELCIILEKMGLLATSDWAALAVMCELWVTYVDACEECKRSGDTILEEGRTKKNPAYMVKREAGLALASLAGDFGLTPIGRTRVKVKVDDGAKDNPIARILQMREAGA